MSVVKKNLLSNFVANIWIALVSIIFFPVYIRLLGVEAYGLIGFYATLSGTFIILDLGISATVKRELARLSALENGKEESNIVLRTFELVYVGVAIFLGIIVIGSSSIIANRWLTDTTIDKEVIKYSLILMGILLALRWPRSIYFGGLIGLQKQVTLNFLKVASATSSAVGVIFILYFIKPSIVYYFYWQIIIAFLSVFIARYLLWDNIKVKNFIPSFDKKTLFKDWRFAAGMSGIAILASFFIQADKILLSKILSLENFAYYVLAASVASRLKFLITPVYQAVYPKMVQLVSLGEESKLIELYHNASQAISVMVLPFALTLCAFSPEIILLWTQDADLTLNVAPVLSILIIGTALHGLLNVPYAVQVAYGWTKLAFYLNFVSIIVLFPLLFFFTKAYGVIGAASIWLILNVGSVLISQQFMHAKYLKNEKLKWYLYDVFIPLVSIASVILIGRLLVYTIDNQILKFFLILVTFCSSLFCGAMSTSFTRTWSLSTLNKSRSYLIKAFKK